MSLLLDNTLCLVVRDFIEIKGKIRYNPFTLELMNAFSTDVGDVLFNRSERELLSSIIFDAKMSWQCLFDVFMETNNNFDRTLTFRDTNHTFISELEGVK